MLKQILRSIRAAFSWKEIGQLGVNTYLENTVTGERSVLSGEGGYSPIDIDWVSGREDDLFRERVRRPPGS